MLPAARAILVKFYPAGIVAAILLGDVIPLFTIDAGKRDVASNRFFCHFYL